MKILLTGTTGFLGKYVIDELKDNAYQVAAFGRNEKIGKTLVDENVEFYKGDIENLDDLFRASQDCTAVIHAAALSTVWGKWEDFYNINVLGTKNIVATKGRASYLGERSIEHLDPGAVSSYLMIKTVCENI